MFKDAVGKTALTTDLANSFFIENPEKFISGDAYMASGMGEDVTFIATARALLWERATEPITIWHDVFNTSFIGEDVSPEDMTKKLFDQPLLIQTLHGDSVDKILIVNIRGQKERCAEVFNNMSTIKENGYEEIEKIGAYFTSFSVRCYVNKEYKNTIFFVERMNLQKYHLLQGAILPSVPWYYNGSCPASEEEVALVSSLQEESPDRYLSLIEKIAERYDFKSSFIKNSLAGFELAYEKSRECTIKSMIDRDRDRIDGLLIDIGNYHAEIRRLQHELTGIQLALETQDNGIMDYFLNSKNVELVNMHGSESFTFRVRTVFSVWNEDRAELAIGNDRSEIYRHTSNKEDARVFLKAAFLDRKIKLHTFGTFNMYTTELSAIQRPEEPPYRNNVLPNPHLYYHACMDMYKSDGIAAIRAGNFIHGLDCCVASAGNLNFDDGTVMGELSNMLFNYDEFRKRKFVEMPNGEMVDVETAISLLKGESNE